MTAHALQSLSLQAAGADVLAPAGAGSLLALTFRVPLEDTAEFASLPEKRRTEINLTLRLLERLHGAKRFVQASQELAQSFAQYRGCSAPALRKKYYALRDSVSAEYPRGNWRALLKGYKPPVHQPPEFVAFIKRLAEENHRSMKAAWRVLIEDLWPNGEPIPGYGTWVEWYVRTFPGQAVPKRCPRKLVPAGWSKRNLYRYAPTKGELATVRQGFKAAKRYFPHVRRDTAQLRPLELVAIDDFETDVLALFTPADAGFGTAGLTRPQVCRVGGLLAIDVGTRRKLHFGLKPRLERADGTHMGIQERDVAALLFEVFRKWGLPEYTVTILCERATAAISPERELALASIFDGRIRIERTNLIEHRTLKNGFTERGGCPWEKGWIESEFNYLWNEAATLPGYKGSNQRLNAPGDLDAKIAYAERLIADLPAEKLAQARVPFMNVGQAVEAFASIFERADRRDEHRFVGFDDVTEFRLGAGSELRPWAELALLPAEQHAEIEPVLRKESPLERWEKLSRQYPRREVPSEVLALLLLTPKKGLTYRNRAVSFSHAKQGYSYVDARGDVLRGLPEGTELFGYFDEANPLELAVCDAAGRFLGTLRRLGGERGAVDIRDKEALASEAALTRTIQNRTLSEIRERHAEADAQLAADRAHNDALIAAHQAEQAAPVSPDTQRLARACGTFAAREKQRQRTADALQRIDEIDPSNLL